jgi:hypothetical protein
MYSTKYICKKHAILITPMLYASKELRADKESVLKIKNGEI